MSGASPSSAIFARKPASFNRAGGAISLPQQAVPLRVKQSIEWQKDNMDFFDYKSAAQVHEKMAFFKNYQYLSGHIDKTDYRDVTDPLFLGMESEAKYGKVTEVEHFPIGIRPVQAMLGECIKRPLNYYCRNFASDARNEFMRQKSDMLFEGVMTQVNYNIAKKNGLDDQAKDYQDQLKAFTPQRIQDYFDKDYQDVSEQVAQRILGSIWKEESLDDVFLEGFRHAVINAIECYHIYTVNGHTKIKEISPLDIFYHKSPSERWISKGQYAGYRLYLTPSSIIDQFYDDLSESDLKKIQALMDGNGVATVNSNGAISYDTSTYSDFNGHLNLNQQYQLDSMLHNFQMFGSSGNMPSSTFGLLRVVIAYWKSEQLVGFLKRRNPETGLDDTLDLVDENYTINKEAGEWVKYKVCNQVYQGMKIHDDIYLGVRPFTDYIMDVDELHDCLLPIDGCIYGGTESKSVSMVDIVKQWNKLYNVMAHDLKKDMKSSLGRVFLMSLDHMPSVPGFTQEKWMYWMRELKIAWVKQPARGGGNAFNQFNSVDMSFAQDMIAKMNMLERIKMECDSLAGFSPNRIASPTPTGDTLGEASQKLQGSVNQTEYIFFKHNKLIGRVLNYAVNMAKKNAHTYGTLRNLMDDMENAYLDDEAAAKFTNAKIGTYVTNSLEDLTSRQKLDEMLNLATSNGADIVDVTDMLLARTMSEVRNIQERLRRDRKTREQISARQQDDVIKQKAMEVQMVDARERDIAAGRDQTSIETAYIKTFALQKDNEKDNNGDGEADILQFEELSHERFKHQQENILKTRKQFMDEQFTAKKLHLEEKKIQAEIYRADMGLEVAKVAARSRPKANK